MRSESEVYLYQETLEHYRDKAKATVKNSTPDTPEHIEAFKLFYRCDGAIQILNWIMGLEADTGFNLPPIARKG